MNFAYPNQKSPARGVQAPDLEHMLISERLSNLPSRAPEVLVRQALSLETRVIVIHESPRLPRRPFQHRFVAVYECLYRGVCVCMLACHCM